RPGTNGEIQLTDALLQLQRREGLLGHRYRGRRWDTGNRLGFLQASIDFALRRPELRDGVLALLNEITGREQT
ncbi:MAG: UTP--glucose-1-phosphate uridylyltransferase, partial [bacterium]